MGELRFSELNAVLAVATRGSFRGAAADLGMSASSLSHAVAALEQRMGVRLFHRTTRSVSLSEAGASFLARIRPALLELSEAVESANDFRESPRGTIRINASEASARIALPLILRFLSQFPEMKVDLVADGRLLDIVKEGFDAGIRRQDSVPADMIAVPFGPRLGYAVVGSPRYFRDRLKPKVPEDLLTHECIRRRLPGGALFHWEFKRGEQGVDPRRPWINHAERPQPGPGRCAIGRRPGIPERLVRQGRSCFGAPGARAFRLDSDPSRAMPLLPGAPTHPCGLARADHVAEPIQG